MEWEIYIYTMPFVWTDSMFSLYYIHIYSWDGVKTYARNHKLHVNKTIPFFGNLRIHWKCGKSINAKCECILYIFFGILSLWKMRIRFCLSFWFCDVLFACLQRQKKQNIKVYNKSHFTLNFYLDKFLCFSDSHECNAYC